MEFDDDYRARISEAIAKATVAEVRATVDALLARLEQYVRERPLSHAAARLGAARFQLTCMRDRLDVLEQEDRESVAQIPGEIPTLARLFVSDEAPIALCRGFLDECESCIDALSTTSTGNA